jgi:hypothetical protein
MKRIQVAALLTGLVGFAGLQAGCNIGTPAAYALFGAGTIDAEYELAPVRTVVFVDDRANELPRTTLRTSIADKVSTDLLAEGCITSAIEPRQAITVTRKKEGSGKPMSIAAIGRELDCQQVIYVQIVEFTLQGDGEFTSAGSETGVGVRPTAKVSVKVIDVVNGVRTYPGGDLTGGRELTATMREVDPNQLQSFSSRRAVEDKLALELGEQIAKLFYEHDRIEHGENLGPRDK